MSSENNYIIVHGTRNNPAGNWVPWLKAELEKTGGKVFVPAFPTPEQQCLTGWKKAVTPALEQCDPADTILIGHSTGAIFVLRLAEQATTPFKAVYSICPFACDLGLADYDPLNASFVHPEPDWQKIKHGAKKIICYAGDNDPYVPLAYSHDVARHLDAKLNIIKSGGHLNAESGYTRFPALLDRIIKG